MTAEYAREREQFDRPIGSFQAVGQRLADGYIDVKGLRLTVTQAAWRLSEDLPADTEVATAAFWAADAGHRVAHTIVHIHGGVGIDTYHPVHRYFLAAKQTEFAVGGATGQLLKIGRQLADTPAELWTLFPPSPICWHRWSISTTGASISRIRSSAGATISRTVRRLPRHYGHDSVLAGRRTSGCCWKIRRSSLRYWPPPR